MAYAYALGTITDLEVRPGSWKQIPDHEDVGGDNSPIIRVANAHKNSIDVFVEPDASATGPILAHVLAMAASLIDWSITCTDTDIGTAGVLTGKIESVNIAGESAMIATIVIA